MVDQAVVDRFWSKVNKTDECWLWASIPRHRYARFDAPEAKVKMAAHRFSWSLANGEIPEGMVIDHICHTPACVRPDHLRLATPKQNLEHVKLSSANTSGYRGVVWNKKSGFWQAVVVHNYHRYFLGFFPTAEMADAAARAKRLELYTHNEFDRGSDPEFRPVPQCKGERARGGRCSFRGHNDGYCHRHVKHALASKRGTEK